MGVFHCISGADSTYEYSVDHVRSGPQWSERFTHAPGRRDASACRMIDHHRHLRKKHSVVIGAHSGIRTPGKQGQPPLDVMLNVVMMPVVRGWRWRASVG